MLRLLLIFLCLAPNAWAQSVFDLARTGSAKQMEQYLLKHPTHLHLTSEHGATPLLLATYRGNFEVAQVLLRAGADPNQCFKEGAPI